MSASCKSQVSQRSRKLARAKIARDIDRVLTLVDPSKTGLLTKPQVDQTLWLLRITQVLGESAPSEGLLTPAK